MSAVNESRCLTLNYKQIAAVAVPLAVGVALAIIGVVLTQVVTAAIAYSLVGAGGASVIASLTYLAVTLCKSKQVDNPDNKSAENPPKPVEAPKEVIGIPKTPEPRTQPFKSTVKETKKVEVKKEKTKAVLSSSESETSKVSDSKDDLSLSMEDSNKSSDSTAAPSSITTTARDLLLKYCKQVGDQEEALTLLRKNVKEGAYTFYQKTTQIFGFCVIGPDMKELEDEIVDPSVCIKRSNYSNLYKDLKLPVLPDGSDLSAEEIHYHLMDYKNIALMQELDACIGCSPKPQGAFHEFVEWLKNRPTRIGFNPTFFLNIIGSSFGLRGEYESAYRGVHSKGKETYHIDFEGGETGVGKAIIMYDWLQELKRSKFPLTIKNKIAETFRFAWDDNNGNPEPSAKKLIEMLEAGIPITIFTGWDGHSVNVTMTEEEVFITNKGENAGNLPGMRRFKVQSKITEAKLQKILDSKGLHSKNFFPQDGVVSELEKILDLKYVNTIPSSEKKVGNCIYASNRKSYHAAPLLLGVDEKTAKEEFRIAKHRTLLRWLDIFFVIIDKTLEEEELQNELYFTLLCVAIKRQLKTTNSKGKPTPYDHEIINKIDKKVRLLQKEKAHPYLAKTLEVIKGKIHWDDLPPDHKKVVQKMTDESLGYYKAKI